MPTQKKDKKISNKSLGNKKGGAKPELVKVFVKRMLEVTPTIRLFHWKTDSYAAHKATDSLMETLNEVVDKYVETMLGKTNVKLQMSDYHTLTIKTPNTNSDLESFIKELIQFLLTFHKKLDNETDTDLLNIRDEMIGDLNKFLYLLRLK
jgi:hypothetical protein